MFTQINDQELKESTISKEASFSISTVDINLARSVISDNDLEGLAGGGDVFFNPTVIGGGQIIIGGSIG